MNYEDCLLNLAQKDQRIIVMTAENRAPIKNLPSILNERFIDTGITEQCMLGAAAGLALRGRIVVAHALSSFLTLRGYEFIRSDICLPNLPVKLVGFVPGFLSDGNGPTHQAIDDIGILRIIPNMKIFCPSDEEELVNGFPEIIEDPSPWYIRLPSTQIKVKHNSQFKIGESELAKNGKDITLITYGALLKNVIEASEILEEKSISVRVINIRTIQPLDLKKIIEAFKETKLIVCVEDHFKKGGLFTILSEIAFENKLLKDLFSISLDDRWFKPGRLEEVLEYEGFTPDKIANRILQRYDKF